MNPIRRLREDLGQTQQEMADAIGISRQRWAKMEQSTCSAWVACQILDTWKSDCKRLKIDLETLVWYGR